MTAIDWEPALTDVGALIAARTRPPGQTALGTFTDKTWPTKTAVESLIGQAVRRVASAIGVEPCTDDLKEDAKSAAAIYTAMLVEQSYFPEQTTSGGNSFKSLESLWKDQIKTLTEQVGEQCGGGDGEAIGGIGQQPHSTFDDRQLVGPNSPEM